MRSLARLAGGLSIGWRVLPHERSSSIVEYMSRFAFLAALGFLLPSAAVNAERLQPNDKWVINFADNRCEAIRSFGPQADSTILMIKPSPTSGVIQIALIKDGKKSRAVQEEASLAFGGGSRIKLKQLRYGTATKNVRLINLDPETAAKLGASDGVTWAAAGMARELMLGEMSSVMKVLGDCRADLRKYWNIEPDLRLALREEPSTLQPLIRAFSTGDYPDQAFRNNQGGLTSVVLLIDEKGKLADCMVDETSGVAVLDAMACLVIEDRVKFRPAIGPDGKPARAVMTQRIRWEMR